MRRRYQLLCVFALSSSLLYLTRGKLYRAAVRYESVDTRPSQVLPAGALLSGVPDAPSLEDALAQTRSTLRYTFATASSSPAELLRDSLANCVGYAALYAALVHTSLSRAGTADEFRVVHHVGQLHVFGVNIHDYLDHPFLRDHDYVEVRHRGTGQAFFVDPTVSDYLGIDRVRAR